MTILLGCLIFYEWNFGVGSSFSMVHAFQNKPFDDFTSFVFCFFLHIFILKNLDKIATNLINWDENDQFRIKGVGDGMSRVGKNPSHRGTCKNSLKARFVFCFGIAKYQKKLE